MNIGEEFQLSFSGVWKANCTQLAELDELFNKQALGAWHSFVPPLGTVIARNELRRNPQARNVELEPF